MANPYSTEFYETQVDGSLRSAETILALLWQIAQPRSVVDVGCGRGTWLAVAARLGADVLTGLDGDWIAPSELLSARIQFVPTNLEAAFRVESPHDLCISMEVAEHLPESSARTFVESLCASSSLVLFSAAVKGQGGQRHVNEQPQSHWIRLFRNAGYECLDVIRPSIWMNESVEWWYRQNTFLFHHPDYHFETPVRLPCAPKEYADLIHPELLRAKLTMYQRLHEKPPLRWLASRILASMRHSVLGKLT